MNTEKSFSLVSSFVTFIYCKSGKNIDSATGVPVVNITGISSCRISSITLAMTGLYSDMNNRCDSSMNIYLKPRIFKSIGFRCENLSTVRASPRASKSGFLFAYENAQSLSCSTLDLIVDVNGMTIITLSPSFTKDFIISVLPRPAPASISVIFLKFCLSMFLICPRYWFDVK